MLKFFSIVACNVIIVWSGCDAEESSEIGLIIGKEWSYQHLQMWPLSFPTCSDSETEQSPINLAQDAIHFSDLEPLLSQGYDEVPIDMMLENNGHTISITANWEEIDNPPSLKGGPLTSDYEFAQVHLHWGATNDTGSEHTIDGKQSALEVHVLHYKKEYNNMSEAAKHPDGIAVMGLLYRVEDTENEWSQGFDIIENNIDDVLEPKSTTMIDPFSLEELEILPEFWAEENEFFTYKGSLTTPPCTEVVTWLVKRSELPITPKFMAALRKLKLNNGDVFNYRPIQPQNSRMIQRVRFVGVAK